jgi:class 3 adenylate cyclase
VAEMRSLSIMFADLVDSVAMSEILELEEQYELQQHFQSLSIAVVERFGGFIARSLGDGLLVYFGYPIARETDAERSIRAGLAIVEQVRSCAFKCRNGTMIELAVRVGIHTGRVVLGATGTRSWQTEYEIVGKAPNVAARLQTGAAPNSVVISEDTFNLVAGHFYVEDLGQHQLRGISEPLNTFRVTGVQVVDVRFDGPLGGRNSPLVGRRFELEKLHSLWARGQAAGALTVMVTGDAGVGKSRGFEAFPHISSCEWRRRIPVDRVARPSGTTVSPQSSPFRRKRHFFLDAVR